MKYAVILSEEYRRLIPEGRILVLYDGLCNLCSGLVRFILRHDTDERCVFASLQSHFALDLMTELSLQQAGETIVVIENQQVYTESAAVLKLSTSLAFPWSLCYVFTLVPRSLRDAVYRLVARHRSRWFGRRVQCMIPPPELQHRFLD